MKKSIIFILLSFLTLSALAQPSTLDDSISEKLAPLLSNYLGDFSIGIQAEYVYFAPEPTIKKNPVLLIAPTDIDADSLRDCEENASSMVCHMAKAIENYIKINALTKGKIILNIKIFQDNKLKEEIKEVEVLSF